MSSKGNILIFGGSFDPPHLGHKAMLEHVLGTLYKRHPVSRVLIMPSNIQPLKGGEFSSASHRLAMCGIQFNTDKIDKDLVKGLELIVSDHEIKKGGITYTIDTIRHLKGLYPEQKLYLLIGEDSFFDIEKWKEPAELLSLCNIIVLAREGTKKCISSYIERIKEEYKANIILIDDFDHPASSTEVRLEILKGDEPKYMDDDVLAYISKNKLYR